MFLCERAAYGRSCYPRLSFIARCPYLAGRVAFRVADGAIVIRADPFILRYF